ncbi:Crp/Fnr family transcriptional regulator [Chryseobacterium sp. M5]|uniref:Crp/Fnr family transcriptional regulator n=1 Tax=Chryseobacterium sp. M5 TaxID=3379128 RepID=UPI00385723A7
MKTNENIRKIFEYIGGTFLEELQEFAIKKTIAARSDIISEGEKINYIPILLKGSVKVFSLNDGKELLYYYIKPYETCTMTFSSIFSNSKSRIYACTEESSDILLLPVDKVLGWIVDYPLLNQFFLKEYDKRYIAIMEMVTQAVFYKLDKRILDLLNKKIQENGGKAIKISHKEIANTLGTAREVVSRILKKYENEGVVTQANQWIMIL